MNCIWCNQIIEEKRPLSCLFSIENSICLQCSQLFQPLPLEKVCPGCGRLMEQCEYCYDCVRWKVELGERFVQNQALYQYDEVGKQFMERYKFVGDCRVAGLIRKKLQEKLLKYLLQGYVVCPLPSSANSMKNREFEAVTYLLKVARIPFQQLLQHIGDGKKQSEKTRAERMQLQQPFCIKEGVELPSKVILFDDVYTTGRTIRLAAECLQERGVKKIICCTIFR